MARLVFGIDRLCRKCHGRGLVVLFRGKLVPAWTNAERVRPCPTCNGAGRLVRRRDGTDRPPTAEERRMATT